MRRRRRPLPATALGAMLAVAGCQLVGGIDERALGVEGGAGDAGEDIDAAAQMDGDATMSDEGTDSEVKSDGGGRDAASETASDAAPSMDGTTTGLGDADAGDACAPGTPVCTAGAKRCSGNGVQTCRTCGQGGSGVAGAPCVSCAGGSCAAITSCAPGGAGMTNCGSGTESCCTSLEVPAGAYDRSYDGLSSGYTTPGNQATVSGFRLDQYEVTVGRFRQFVDAIVTAGALPPALSAGAGKHTYLNGGNGLSATGGGYETGWDATDWNGPIATTASGWNSNLICSADAEWTPTAGTGENLPIGCLTWFEAYAFCIWDGGLLPSEAEWNYAAAGGGQQRAYPWAPAYPPGSTSISCTNANYNGCPAGGANAVGSESPAGDGLWGQSDLAGSVAEWNLDLNASYVTPCVDCANLTTGSNRVFRGGGFYDSTTNQLASFRAAIGPSIRYGDVGVRCARAP